VPGLLRISRPVSRDDRGTFSKVIGEGDDVGNRPFVTREIFWSGSTRGVFRGMHVQLPPRATRKLVFVPFGSVRDFVLDLRVGSPTFGLLWEGRLDEQSGGLIIPEGCAHGFEVVSDSAVMAYAQEDFHSADHDGGIEYSSAGVVLDTESAVVSPRDLSLPVLSGFDSPFRYS
jgi:dTDP-4-dehydrorhamnose 3,5-epimerase